MNAYVENALAVVGGLVLVLCMIPIILVLYYAIVELIKELGFLLKEL